MATTELIIEKLTIGNGANNGLVDGLLGVMLKQQTTKAA